MLIAKWILRHRKKCGASEVDPLNFPVREQGPIEGLVSSLKYYSKTRIDKNRRRAPSGVGKTSQQKRHPIRSAFLNGVPKGFVSMQLKNLKKLNRLLYLLNILDGGEIRVPREDGARKQAAPFLWVV